MFIGIHSVHDPQFLPDFCQQRQRAEGENEGNAMMIIEFKLPQRRIRDNVWEFRRSQSRQFLLSHIFVRGLVKVA